MTAASITRLHISPLNPDLLHAILHPSAREAATDISYHTVQTFPENSYGFVNLPKMEAEKVTKKLNGAILKGKKLKIQEARPSKRPAPDTHPPAADSTPPQPKPEKVTKKRKSSDKVVDGYDLPSDRHVKRGWTEPGHKDKRSRKADKEEKKRTSQKSKYTEKAECLFRTTVPPNKIDLEKEKKKSGEKKKKDKKAPGATVVHEFENSVTVPSFLRSGDNASAAGFTNEFVEGKGWVDREGNVKEPPPPPAKTRIDKEKVHAKGKAKQLEQAKGGISTAKPATKKLADTSPSSEVDDDETSSSGSSSDSSSDEESEDVTSSSGSDDEDEDTSSVSSSNESSSSSSDEEEEDEKTDNEATPRAKNPTTQPTPSITVTPSKPQSDEANEPTEIHPLEALFKRPATKPRRDSISGQKRPLEINTQFSFFSADNNDDDIEEEEDEDSHHLQQHNTLNVPEPQTPFTKQDLLTRVVRSAAPTPDTAAPHKGRFWDHNDDDDDDRMDLDDNDYYGDGEGTFNGAETPSKAATAGKGQSKKEKGGEVESDFSKWFWENRGDNNRAWKRRRREAAKEKRQRENRSKGFRGK
ncbi:hypothetical protein FQN50_009229 [Emmonsiellopsis sp. PD_5]|nr:hypothetical protein FQN50_009229 [Emmonsiellopsis sp. PD_5]